MPIKYEKQDNTPLLVPDTYRDLFVRPIVVALVTLMPDGQPQATPIWADYDGTFVRVNSARGRQKDKNMQIGARVTLLVIDPADTGRWLEVRGRIAEVTEEGAVEHINALNLKYEGHADFFANKEDERSSPPRVTYKIEPFQINTNS
ncbi:MAG: TIGR03618 family F420-dependent PPOX class oxidoreductase [Anaerolineaceae bacterium]|nr:TIGR03618 family F420-dependent PPOX class oxidoreductase [Anaerolineaceae bacterium]